MLVPDKLHLIVLNIYQVLTSSCTPCHDRKWMQYTSFHAQIRIRHNAMFPKAQLQNSRCMLCICIISLPKECTFLLPISQNIKKFTVWITYWAQEMVLILVMERYQMGQISGLRNVRTEKCWEAEERLNNWGKVIATRHRKVVIPTVNIEWPCHLIGCLLTNQYAWLDNQNGEFFPSKIIIPVSIIIFNSTPSTW